MVKDRAEVAGAIAPHSHPAPASTVSCAACGFEAEPSELLPFRCLNAGVDDADHVMVRRLDPDRVRFPTRDDPNADANPFVRYREMFHAHHLGLAEGLSDAAHVRSIRELDGAVAQVDGHGFEVTPFGRAVELSSRLGYATSGGVWVKDETGNVSGSHKARHLMGLMAHLRVVEAIEGAGAEPRDLAIASCGNAALGAAVVAKAAGRRLLVFVPEWADAAVIARLRALDAVIEQCPRSPDVPGDPAYHRLRRAIAEGAIPFTCQGPDNGLTIEGGRRSDMSSYRSCWRRGSGWIVSSSRWEAGRWPHPSSAGSMTRSRWEPISTCRRSIPCRRRAPGPCGARGSASRMAC